MPRMRAPFTGVVHEVSPSRVDARLKAGYVLLDGAPAPVDVEADDQPAEDDGGKAADKPGADSTIAEIRTWAKANGVALPKKGNKAALLAAIE